MMYWVSLGVLHVLILSAINIEPVLMQHVRVVCVKPMYGHNDTMEDSMASCKKWSSVMDFPERYFTSNTNIQLLATWSVPYELNLQIAYNEHYKFLHCWE